MCSGHTPEDRLCDVCRPTNDECNRFGHEIGPGECHPFIGYEAAHERGEHVVLPEPAYSFKHPSGKPVTCMVAATCQRCGERLLGLTLTFERARYESARCWSARLRDHVARWLTLR